MVETLADELLQARHLHDLRKIRAWVHLIQLSDEAGGGAQGAVFMNEARVGNRPGNLRSPDHATGIRSVGAADHVDDRIQAGIDVAQESDMGPILDSQIEVLENNGLDGLPCALTHAAHFNDHVRSEEHTSELQSPYVIS